MYFVNLVLSVGIQSFKLCTPITCQYHFDKVSGMKVTDRNVCPTKIRYLHNESYNKPTGNEVEIGYFISPLPIPHSHLIKKN